MAIKISKTVRNAMLNAIESTIGTGAVLVTMQLAADWMAAASSGVKVFSGIV